MRRNIFFFSIFGLWETLGDSADALGGFATLGMLWGALGKLFGDALGMLWEALGMLWEALGGFGGALGGFGDARRPPPNKKTTIYKNVGS